MLNFDLTADQEALIDRFSILARENLPRGRILRSDGHFPSEDFRSFQRWTECADRWEGEWGCWVRIEGRFTLWMITSR
jgi:hypothetical protein